MSNYICHGYTTILCNQVASNVLVIWNSEDGLPSECIRSLLQGLKEEAETASLTVEGVMKFLRGRLVEFHSLTGVVIDRVWVCKSRCKGENKHRGGIDCLSHVGIKSTKSIGSTENVRRKSSYDDCRFYAGEA